MLLGLRPASLSLVSQELLVGLVCLQLVDVLMRIHLFLNTFPLTFSGTGLVHMAVNLLGFPVSLEKPAQDPHSSHPDHLLGHRSIGSTLPLPYAHMPALPSGQGVFPATSPGMDSHRLADDQPIFDQLLDLLTGVGIDDFTGLIGIQPDLLLPNPPRSGGH